VLLRPASILILLCAASFQASSQYATATISGSVKFEDGAPVPGALVQWFQGGQPITLVTDSQGEFRFHFVAPGRRVLRFEVAGSGRSGKCEVTVEPGASLNISVLIPDQAGRDAGEDLWEIRVSRRDGPDAWQPERTLTRDRIDTLPGTEHLWSLLNHTEISVVADRYDIAGMSSQRQFLLGVRGSSWTQNPASLQGLPAVHPGGEGMLMFPDLSAMEAVIYDVGGSPIRHTGPGAHLAFLPKSGEGEVHGEARLFFQSGALQNTNVSRRLRFFGITESDERWKRFLNGSVQLGGPLGGRRWTYFGALSVRDIEKHIRNHTLPVSAKVNQGTIHLAGTLPSGDRLGVFWSGQRLDEPQAGASPQVTRESSLDQTQSYQAVQGSWTRYFSPKSLVDLRLGLRSGKVRARFQRGVRGQSREDLFGGFALAGVPGAPSPYLMVEMLSNTKTGPAPAAGSSDAASTVGSAMYSSVRSGPWNTSHRITAGINYQRMDYREEQVAVDGVNLLFFQQEPNAVRVFDPMSPTRDRVSQLEAHASDHLSVSRLSLKFGVSVSSAGGASLMSGGAQVNSRRWTNAAGRLGAAYRIGERHPLVLTAGLARIYNQPLSSLWTASNPEGPGTAYYSWSDFDGDGRFAPGENTRLLKIFGPPHTRMDASLQNPRTTEITMGLTQAGPAGLVVRLFGFRRFEHRLVSLVNVGVPFSAYTPVRVPDPGPDGEVGSADDSYVTIFDQKPETLGQDRYLLTNPGSLRGFSEGFELKVAFSSSLLQAEAAMTRYRAVAPTAPGITARENDTSALLGVFDDPNKAILARGSTYFDRGTLGRLYLSSTPAWDVRCSWVISYQDGLPYSRYLPVQGLNQGVVAVLTRQRGPGEKGSRVGPMTSHYETIDMRMIKDFALGRGRIEAIVDVFNLANRAQPLVQTEVTAPTQYWRIPIRFQTPRSIQLGLRYRW
jgi:hypothetical protein